MCGWHRGQGCILTVRTLIVVFSQKGEHESFTGHLTRGLVSCVAIFLTLSACVRWVRWLTPVRSPFLDFSISFYHAPGFWIQLKTEIS